MCLGGHLVRPPNPRHTSALITHSLVTTHIGIPGKLFAPLHYPSDDTETIFATLGRLQPPRPRVLLLVRD